MFEQESPTFSIQEKDQLKENGKKEEIILPQFTTKSPGYVLWIQAGQKPPSLPQNPDPNYNSNIWHNFKNHFTLNLSANHYTISQSTAIMYPLTLPKYSQMGEINLDKFLDESSYFKNSNWKSWILKRPPSNEKQLAKLKLLSELRNLHQDKKGIISSQKNYKTFIKSSEPALTKVPSPSFPIFGVPRDLFGRKMEQKIKKKNTKLTSKKINVPRKSALN